MTAVRHLLACLALGSFACGASGGGGTSEIPAEDLCEAGQTRCSANAYQVCGDEGAFETAEQCEFGCGDDGCLPPVDECKVSEDGGGDGVGQCSDVAPPDSFTPDVQWSWMGDGVINQSGVIPLVGNFTDDNNDGAIDLCDTPDILVVAGESLFSTGFIYLLDGASGDVHFKIERAVNMGVTPAFGDIDNDGLPEIVAADPMGNTIAFEHDGTFKWLGDNLGLVPYGAVALADVDNDGDVEIFGGGKLADHEGNELWARTGQGTFPASTAADLDGDGDLELVFGRNAYHHDGSVAYESNAGVGFPQIGNFDADPQPEILITNNGGLTMLDHLGNVIFENLRPTGAASGGLTWIRPAAIHDMNGDGNADFAVSSGNQYTVFEADGSIQWSSDVLDSSGVAGGTAFDFLGDGVAEAMYADETKLFIFGDNGGVLLDSDRASRTLIEYPVVADIDNDGSAEIVVVSNELITGGGAITPTVSVVRDVQDRWIQARRIWNQHTYHVTNVREDGTIPTHEQPSWLGLNTFRTNAQIQGGRVCDPPVVE